MGVGAYRPVVAHLGAGQPKGVTRMSLSTYASELNAEMRYAEMKFTPEVVRGFVRLEQTYGPEQTYGIAEDFRDIQACLRDLRRHSGRRRRGNVSRGVQCRRGGVR